MAGVNIPLVSVQHQYLITDTIDGVTPNLPTLRDPDRLTYWKEEVGGLVMGGYEPNPKPWAVDGLPDHFEFQLLDDDLEHFEPLLELAAGRVPAMQSAGIKQFINGPESFTPDGNFILGEAPEVRGIFVGAGFNAFGIASGGGAGMVLAEWVAKGEPPYDLWPVDIRRFGKNHLDTELGAHAHARGLRQALHDGLAVRGISLRATAAPLAALRQAQGPGSLLRREARLGTAELVRRSRRAGRRPEDHLQLRAAELVRCGRPRAQGLPRACRRVRPDVIRQVPSGRPRCGGGAVVDRANDVAKPPGHLVYTQMLNDRGGIECDLTVGRLSPTEYYIVTGTGFATHDFDWISRSIPDGLDARLIDVTSSHAVLSVMGPRSRDVLQGLTEHDMSNAGFPFGRVKRITVAGAPVLALRVTYVGELGFELHIPVEFAAERLRRADGSRASRTASPTPATAPSSRCAWKRATEPGARISGPTTPRWSPASAGP